MLVLAGCEHEEKVHEMSLDYFWKHIKDVKTKLTKENIYANKNVQVSEEKEELNDTGGQTSVIFQTLVEITEESMNVSCDTHKQDNDNGENVTDNRNNHNTNIGGDDVPEKDEKVVRKHAFNTLCLIKTCGKTERRS